LTLDFYCRRAMPHSAGVVTILREDSMTPEYVSQMYTKALTYATRRRSWFTATEMSKGVKCAKRTARFYCQIMSKKGIVEKMKTYPSLTYRTKKIAKKK